MAGGVGWGGGGGGTIWGLVTSLNAHLTRLSLASLFKMANLGDTGVKCAILKACAPKQGD